MYFVKYGTEYLHDPNTRDTELFELSFESKENSCGFCDFTIQPNHPMYSKIKERDIINPITVYDDDTLLFAGFIYELGKEFYLSGQVKCKGDLSFLNETIVRPYSTHTRGYGNVVSDTVGGYFEWLIQQHNDQVNPNKQFVVGINQGASLDSNNYIFRESDAYPTTYDEINEKIINDLGGYLRVRYENNVRYIDLLYEWTDKNAQILDFGVNLLDYSQTDDAANVATYIVPLGAKISDTEYSYNDGYFVTSDSTVNQTKDYYNKTGSYSYIQCSDLEAFETNKTYYEYDKATSTYSVTSDTKANPEKDYYIKSSKGAYSQCNDIAKLNFYEHNETDDTYSVTADTTVVSGKAYYTKNAESNYSQVSGLINLSFYEYNKDNDESDVPITITDLDNGHYDEGYTKSGDYIYCNDASDKYGFIGTVYENSSITVKKNLITKATVALKELISPKRTIEIKAIDMHMINPDMKPIHVGEYIRVRSNPHNFDSYMLCTSIDLDLNSPENSNYVLGTTFDTLTGEQNKRINKLNSTINTTYEAAATLSDESKVLAQEAATTAKKAQEMADTAQSTASTANETATTASKTASEAQETASTANTTATEAKETADGLSEDVSTAQETAEEAQTTANSASETASEAQITASSAVTSAEEAKTTAEEAKTIVEDLSESTENNFEKIRTEYTKKTELQQTSDSINMNFTTLQETIVTNQNGVNSTFAEWNNYIRFQDGNIVLGKEGNNVTCKITNDKLAFLQNNTEVAYLSDNQLFISKAQITNRLQIGNFEFRAKADGGMTIVKTI